MNDSITHQGKTLVADNLTKVEYIQRGPILILGPLLE